MHSLGRGDTRIMRDKRPSQKIDGMPGTSHTHIRDRMMTAR